jgi:hypothetical protein
MYLFSSPETRAAFTADDRGRNRPGRRHPSILSSRRQGHPWPLPPCRASARRPHLRAAVLVRGVARGVASRRIDSSPPVALPLVVDCEGSPVPIERRCWPSAGRMPKRGQHRAMRRPGGPQRASGEMARATPSLRAMWGLRASSEMAEATTGDSAQARPV